LRNKTLETFPQFDRLVNYKIISLVIPTLSDHTILDVNSIRQVSRGARDILYTYLERMECNFVRDVKREWNGFCELDVQRYLSSKHSFAEKIQTMVMFYYALMNSKLRDQCKEKLLKRNDDYFYNNNEGYLQ